MAEIVGGWLEDAEYPSAREFYRVKYRTLGNSTDAFSDVETLEDVKTRLTINRNLKREHLGVERVVVSVSVTQVGCAECGALIGQEHPWGCDLVLGGEVEHGTLVTPEQCA